MSAPSYIDQLNQEISSLNAADGITFLSRQFPRKIVFSSSLGQEDQVITQIIFSNNLDIEIFTLDTGRLFYETHDLLAKTESRYHKKIKVFSPERDSVEKLVQERGINGFYDSIENRKACCFVRKVEPLQRALKGNTIWITGLRGEQSTNRSAMQKIEWDETNQIIKYNPLLDWNYEEMLAYIKQNKIPYNPLHDKGFVSIGCAPCTRAILPGEEARAGRWWWENSQKECGLHTN